MKVIEFITKNKQFFGFSSKVFFLDFADKLVKILNHEYSSTSLTFDTLKTKDLAMYETLKKCNLEICLATIVVKQIGIEIKINFLKKYK